MAVNVTPREVRQAIYNKAGVGDAAQGHPSTLLLGRLFHQVVADLAGSDPALNWQAALSGLDPEKGIWQERLVEHAYDRLIGPRLTRERVRLQDSAEQTLHFWTACQAMCDWLVDILWAAKEGGLLNEDLEPVDSAGESLFTPELPLVWEIREDGWSDTVRVTGIADLVLRIPHNSRWCVMELKLGRGAEEADLMQACLYHQMLSAGATEQGGPGAMALVSFHPEKKERLVSPEDIQRIKDHLLNLIAEVAGVLPTQPEQTRVLPATEPGDSEAEQEAKRAMDALVAALSALRSPVEPDGYIAGPRFMRLKVKPDVARKVTVRKLCNLAQDLQVQLNLKTPPLIQAQAGHVSVDIPRKTRIPLTLGEVWRRGQQNRPDSKAAFPIGMAIDGSVVWADLSEPTMTSMLVGGTAGSGKSVFLRSAVIAMALNARPQDIQFTLIDPKRVSFTDLTALPHLSGKVLMDNEPALERLGELIEEMEKRYRLFEQEKTVDINGYNRGGGKLTHHVVLIDEYADLIIDRETKDQLELSVRRLGQKGRAAGIHLILATQRPDAKVVTPLIKANLQLKVALKATTGVNSKVILDETGAECLIGHGDMLIGGSVPVQRLQGPLVTKDEIERATRSGA